MTTRDFALATFPLGAGGDAFQDAVYTTVGAYTSLGYLLRWADPRLRLADAVLTKQMFGGQRLSGALDVVATSFALENVDGGLDGLTDLAFDGSDVLLYESTNGGASWGTFVDRYVAEQPIVSEDAVTIAARDYRHKLDVPLLTEKYAGTNSGSPLAGIEGTANDIKGQPKPLLLGTVHNISPVLVNTTKWIFQVDGRSGGLAAGWSMTVYDKRAALTAGANYTSQADMEANVPAAGQYRVWPAGGCFRLGSAPTGRVTADVTNPPFSGDANSLRGVAKRIAQFSDSRIGVFYPLDELWHANPQAGIYLTAEVSCLAALEQVLAGVNGYITDDDWPEVGTSSWGPFFGQLNAPDNLPYVPKLDPIELGEEAILRPVAQVVPDGPARGLPIWRVNLNYKRNYTVMGEADLAGVAAADAEFCKREWRTVWAEDADVKTQWVDAIELNVFTPLIDATEAQAEVDRLLALFKVRRGMYRLRVPGHVIRSHPQFTSGTPLPVSQFQVGSVVTVTYPRFGMGAGRDFIVVGIQRHLGADVYQLLVWG